MLGAEHMFHRTAFFFFSFFLPLFFNPFLNQLEPDGEWSALIVFRQAPQMFAVRERQQRLVYLFALRFIFLLLSICRDTLSDSAVGSFVKMSFFFFFSPSQRAVRHLQSLRQHKVKRCEVDISALPVFAPVAVGRSRRSVTELAVDDEHLEVFRLRCLPAASCRPLAL